jgi:hypothetical protein
VVTPGNIVTLDKAPVSITTGIGPAEKLGRNFFQGTLTAELAEGGNGVGHPPYFFRITVEGVFQFVPEDAGDLDIERVTGVFATSAMLATARELLVSLTARGPHGPVVLPSVLVGKNPEAVARGVAGDLKPVTSPSSYTRVTAEDGKTRVRMRIPLSAPNEYVDINVVRPGSPEQGASIQAEALEESAQALSNFAKTLRNIGTDTVKDV